MLDTPVLFLIFNRPDTTRLVFEAIREARPKKLFIAADGPRIGKETDIERCRQAREVISNIDWNCEVKTLFRETNLGCKYAVSSAIDWFFEQVEEGIILEDDVLPILDFFIFCNSMLEYYRNNLDIMHVSGVNFHSKISKHDESYYFSIYNNIWGWATWRRAWIYYDVQMSSFNMKKDQKIIKTIVNTRSEEKYWLNVFNDVFLQKVDTWDYQWQYTIWKNKGFSITPTVNLVSNIGFGEDATHTRIINPILSEITPTTLFFPLSHPNKIIINKIADRLLYNTVHNPSTTVLNQIRNFCYKYVPDAVYKIAKKLKDYIRNIVIDSV